VVRRHAEGSEAAESQPAAEGAHTLDGERSGQALVGTGRRSAKGLADCCVTRQRVRQGEGHDVGQQDAVGGAMGDMEEGANVA